ncbi:Arc family DNA-binding protein, partial [Pseudomonas aeruginosa]|nr:Arc family DNA-binding protein [Pseudomonas aeruginosa]
CVSIALIPDHGRSLLSDLQENNMKNVTSISRKHAEDKFVVRMPQGLRDQLKQKAAHNHRSANSEIVYRLERSNELEEELARANRMVDELLAKNQRLQAELAAANAPQVAEA